MKEKRLKKSCMYVLLLCVSLLFCGCTPTGESQFTTINEKYLQAENEAELTENDEQNTEMQEQKDVVTEDTVVPEQGTFGGGDEEDGSKKVDKSDKKKKQKHRKEQNQDSEETAASTEKKEQAVADKKADRKTNKKTVKASDKKKTLKKQETTSEKEVTQPSKSPDEKKNYCTVSIDCQMILSNMADLNEVKKEFVPSDGWILKPLKVVFKEGDTAYDILYKVCKEKKIHMEAAYTPAYGTYYVEGIHQLYEFDCGNLSGWTYLVNGVSLNYGASKYKVQSGDEICWRFSCNAGKDVR